MNVIKSNAQYIIKLLINHFVSGVYSLILFVFFTIIAEGKFQLIGSIISIAFYLYLVYSFMWEAGAKRAVGTGSQSIYPTDGILVMIVGSLPYYITIVLCTVFSAFATNSEFAERTIDVAYRVLFYINVFFTQCMYSGLFSSLFDGVANTPAFLYLVSLLPGLAVGSLAYFFGTKSYRIRSLLGIKYNEEKEKIKNNY